MIFEFLCKKFETRIMDHAGLILSVYVQTTTLYSFYLNI